MGQVVSEWGSSASQNLSALQNATSGTARPKQFLSDQD